MPKQIFMMKLKLEYLKVHRTSVIVAFLFAVAIFILAPIMPLVDSAGYMDTAKNIYIGRGFVNNFEPSTTDVSLFPCAAALSMSAFGPGCCWYMKALLAVFGFLLMLSMYLLAYEATGKRNVALMASVLLAILPITVLNAIQLLTDIPFLAFMMICFTFYLKSQKTGKPSDMIACGVFAGVATLTRLTGLIIFGVFLLHQLTDSYC